MLFIKEIKEKRIRGDTLSPQSSAAEVTELVELFLMLLPPGLCLQEGMARVELIVVVFPHSVDPRLRYRTETSVWGS